MEHISCIMARIIEKDQVGQVIHYCPVEKREVSQSYCDNIFCEMCQEDECLAPTAEQRADMNYELLCEKYFD